MILILIYLIYMILINILSFVLVVVVVIVLDKGVVVFYFKKMFLNEIWMICYTQISTIY